MSKLPWIQLLVIASLSLPIAEATAQEAPYRPLGIGYYWEYYYGVPGEYELQRVVRIDTILETDVYAVFYEESPNNQGLENYWTNDTDGSLLLWGFNGGWGLIYDPPIIYIDAPLFSGKSWSCTTTVYELPDTTFYGVLELTFEVLSDTTISVPLGTFDTYGIGYEMLTRTADDSSTEPVGFGATRENQQDTYLLNGRKMTGESLFASQDVVSSYWVYRGIGEIQYEGGGNAQLSAFSVQTGDEAWHVPETSILYQNYPNPFNPVTTVKFEIPTKGHVSLVIYDVAGHLVRTVVNEERDAGRHKTAWDGKNSTGAAVASGIYFYRLVAGDFVQTKKMVLLR